MEPGRPWWAKLRRASAVIDEIKEQYAALNVRGVSWRVDQELEDDRTWRYRLRLLKPVPSDFAVLVGDAIHNMRSALDQIAYDLAVRHVGTLSESQEALTEFPIKATAEGFEEWLRGKRKKPAEVCRADLHGPDEIRALRSVQPFAFAEEAEAVTGESADWLEPDDERRESAAFVLNTLWNVDKHRRLPSLSWVMPSLGYPQREGHEIDHVARLYEPLPDGQVLLRDRALDKRPDRHPFFDFDLRLDDSPSWGDRRLLTTLNHLFDSVTGEIVPTMLHVADGNEPLGLIPHFHLPRE